MADTLIEAERDAHARSPPFTRSHLFLDVETALQGPGPVRRPPAPGRRAPDRREAGADQPGQARRAGHPRTGVRPADLGHAAPAGAPVPLDQLIHPRAEPEIAFLIGDGRRAGDGRRRARGDRGGHAAIEIMDSRYSERFRLPDSVADNAGAARVVLGSRPRTPGELVDLRLIGCVFRSRRRVVGTAAGGAVMGDPAAARRLAGATRSRREASTSRPGASCCPAASRPRWRCGPAQTWSPSSTGSARSRCTADESIDARSARNESR